MNCQQARERVFEFVKGELGEVEREEMRRHLESCETCKAHVDGAAKVLDLMIAASEAPVGRIVDKILSQAVTDGASDIHVEPSRDALRVRYRIDGVMHEVMTFPKEMGPVLATRLKTMAEMNVAETRMPQDGRITTKIAGLDLDFRINSLPTVYGEDLVLRILSRSTVLLGLDKLGLYPDQAQHVRDMARRPNGLFFATGPTGCGKTTTLYSMLLEVNSGACKVMTIEDPVECVLPTTIQTQVQRSAGYTFASGLRAFLRHDPDVVLLGAVRDLEVAEIAFEIALTGHLILSTLHTDDAPMALIRLVDMGVEPYLIRSAVNGVLAQRLVRQICQNCKVAYQATGRDLRALGFSVDDPDREFTLYRAEGCETCHNTGYKGRTGLFELLAMNDEIGELLIRRAPVADIRAAAISAGMTPLREDGLRKVLDGITTPEEVMRVAFTPAA